jgi:hypothetical protein
LPSVGVQIADKIFIFSSEDFLKIANATEIFSNAPLPEKGSWNLTNEWAAVLAAATLAGNNGLLFRSLLPIFANRGDGHFTQPPVS